MKFMFNISTLFENDDFLVVEKPAGVLSVPSRMGKEDPRICLTTILRELHSTKLFPVHRLDFEVRGIILLAKNASAHSLANTWFEKHLILKKYEALTWGTEPTKSDKNQKLHWQLNLLRGKKRAYIHEIAGKPAITEALYSGSYQIADGKILAWEIWPITGKPHQIRFTLSHYGFPIVGDGLYGGKSASFLANHEIALNAVSLDLSQIGSSLRLGLPDKISLKSQWQETFSKLSLPKA